MGAEGYCVNVPWSRGGVGDNDYIFAFQNVVLPIGYYLLLKGTIDNTRLHYMHELLRFSYHVSDQKLKKVFFYMYCLII